MDITKAITHVSLCAGYGGIDLGLKRAIPNLRTVAFSEIEGFACANLVAKMEAGLLDAAPIWTNLKTFPWKDFFGKVDILSGGYPCQPFSAAGKRLGTEDPRHLWPFIADGIRIMQPRVCFFENVEGHISLGLRAVIEELGSLGYKTTWGIFSAREVGAPHQRKRVFIMAYSADWREKSLHDWNSTSTDVIPCRSWPTRPGEPQHGWEPPRVVANSASQRTNNGQQLCGEERRQGGTLPCESNESGEGVGNTNGIDRSASASGRINDTKTGSAGEAVGNAKHDGLHGAAASRSDEADVGSRSKEEPQVVEQRPRASGLGSEIRRVAGDTPEQRLSQRGCGEIHESRSVEELKRPDQIVGDTRDKGSTGSKGEGRAREEGESNGYASESTNDERRQAEPSLGGDSHGSPGGLDYAELCISGDNRTDELRLLGNGVVPATATRAFLTLLKELNE